MTWISAPFSCQLARPSATGMKGGVKEKRRRSEEDERCRACERLVVIGVLLHLLDQSLRTSQLCARICSGRCCCHYKYESHAAVEKRKVMPVLFFLQCCKRATLPKHWNTLTNRTSRNVPDVCESNANVCERV